MTTTHDDATAALARFATARQVLLTTYRGDGTPVGTPVHIAVDRRPPPAGAPPADPLVPPPHRPDDDPPRADPGVIPDATRHRDHLVRVAYRLLGSLDEAEDVVQDALARAERSAPDDVREPVAWLTTVVTHAALDRLSSARVRRESYVGP